MEISHGIVEPHCGAKTAIFGRKTVAARVKVPPACPWAPYVKARHAAGANRLISEPDASQASPGLQASDLSGGVPKKAAPDLEDVSTSFQKARARGGKWYATSVKNMLARVALSV